MRASEFHEWIAREAPPHTPQDEVDGIMAGDPDTVIKGIAVTWLPNMHVLKKAAEAGLNFIVAHEPVFYFHPYFYPYGDDRHYPALDLPQKQATPAAQAKQRLIDEYGLVVYRLHDGWDQFPHYGMGHALARRLGWEDRKLAPEYIYGTDPKPLKLLAAEIAAKLGKSGIRYIGDPDQMVDRISLDWGSPGAIDIVARAQRNGCQAALTGECLEWRDVEYARDSGLALITGGHCATETPGMEACCDWMTAQFPDLPVSYIDSVDPDHFA